MTVEQRKWKVDVAVYQQMVTTGILSEQDKVELIDGQIIEMSPTGSKHAAIVDRINHVILGYLNNQAILRIQNPVQISVLSMPEPDITILKWKEDFYTEAHPKPQDIYLIIEVADTSIEYDRDIKLPLYAQAGISEYWIVDIQNYQIEMYHTPSGKMYRHRELVQAGEEVTLNAFQISIPLEKLIGPPVTT